MNNSCGIARRPMQFPVIFSCVWAPLFSSVCLSSGEDLATEVVVATGSRADDAVEDGIFHSMSMLGALLII